MAMSHSERGRLGGAALQAKKSPEERREAMRRVRLAGAVKAVVDRAPELTTEQVSRLRAVFCEAGR